ncbi:MAG: autotransporter-associated beta strand repeat-containing protein [Verrucomicrobiales bacterium]|jgi:autotransporter-associated beta strand protein|nr:autotransporter-associated beta strand repeat-containing protein [Verrucomicrobiales bacterium]
MKTNQYTLWKLALTVALSLSATWQAQARVWSATPADNKFSNNANWSDLDGPIWYFRDSSITDLLNDLASAPVIQEINYREANLAYSISGGTLALTSQIRNQMTVSQTIGSTLWLQNNVGINNDTSAGGDIWLTGTVVNYGGDRTLTTNLKGHTLHIGALAVSEGATARMFTLSGTDQVVIGSVTGAGAALNGNGFGGFYNRLASTLTVTGSGSYTGDVTLGQASNTILDYTADDGARLGFGGALNVRSNAALTLHGGGTATIENFSSLTLGWGKDQSGHTDILRDSGSATISISGDLRRAAGTNVWENRATLSISGSNLVYAPSVTTINGGILLHYITINGKDWARVDADTGALVAFDDYVNFFDSTSTTDHAVIDGNATLTGNKTVGTLKITTDAASQSLNLDGRQLSFTATSVSGASNGGAAGIYGAYNGSGMIFAGDHDYTISGGVLVTGWQTEFLLWTGGAGALNIAANINGNIITKSGAGTLILSGSFININSHFSINQGQVVIGGEAAASTFGKAVLNLSGGVLDLNGYDVTNTGGFLNPANGTGVIGLSAGGTITNNAATQSVFAITTGGFGRMLESTLFTGSLQLVLSKGTDTYARLYNANTHTGGTVLRDLDSRLGRGELQIANPLFLGPGQVSMEGNASLYVYDGDWSKFANDLSFTSTNNAIMVGQWRTFTSSGAWSGDGVVHLQAENVNAVQSLTGDLSAFTGVLNFSVGLTGRGGDGGVATLKLAANTDLGGSLVLFDSATNEGKFSTLTVQASAAGTIKLAELSTWSAANSSAQFAANSSATVSAAAAGLVTFEVGGGTFGGQLADGSGQVAINKVGSGTWALTGSNSYSGSTTISGGVLLVDDAGSINSTDRVTVNSGEFRYNSSTALTAATYVEAGGALGGSGIIDSVVYLNDANSTITGGGLGTVGELTFNDWQLWGDFTYVWDILDTMTYDKLTFTDHTYGLSLNGNNYTLTVNNPNTVAVENFVILSGLTSGFDADNWSVTGGYELFLDGTDLVLNTIPEPSTWLLLGTGVALLAFLRRRR